jgi:uncharacterized protein (DUF58 family)
MKRLKQSIENFTRDKSNVYIIPTRKGLRFIFINFSLFIIAMAYTNNMALLISFLSFAYFVIQMLEIHKIINTTYIKKIEVENNYYSSDQHVKVKFKEGKFKGDSSLIQLTLECDPTNILANHFNSKNEDLTIFKLQHPKRGFHSCSRVKLHTKGKTGLFYVWRYHKSQLKFYTYPEKKYSSKQPVLSDQKLKLGTSEVEFHSHIPYVSGLNSKRIDWKVFARSEQLYWKKHIDHNSTTFEVNYSTLNGTKEDKLSFMSFLINKYYKDGKSWKLVLPNSVLPSSSGVGHHARSLEAISVF